MLLSLPLLAYVSNWGWVVHNAPLNITNEFILQVSDIYAPQRAVTPYCLLLIYFSYLNVSEHVANLFNYSMCLITSICPRHKFALILALQFYSASVHFVQRTQRS